MKLNTGIDIVEIARIEKSLRHSGFLVRYFGEAERELFAKKNKVSTIAANFAAKEAFAKAMGTGVRGFSLREVEVLRDELSAPYIKLYGNAEVMAKERKMQFSVSLSHDGGYAVAVVVAYSE